MLSTLVHIHPIHKGLQWAIFMPTVVKGVIYEGLRSKYKTDLLSHHGRCRRPACLLLADHLER